MKKYTLVSAETRHAANPNTFKIPSREERNHLAPGDLVKLIFSDMERMWVHVKSKLQDGSYNGSLVSRPAVLREALKVGDEILFGPEHVADIDKKEDRR